MNERAREEKETCVVCVDEDYAGAVSESSTRCSLSRGPHTPYILAVPPCYAAAARCLAHPCLRYRPASSPCPPLSAKPPASEVTLLPLPPQRAQTPTRTYVRYVCVCVCASGFPEMPGRHDLVFLCDYCALCVSSPEMPGMHDLARVPVRLLWPVCVGHENARNARPCVCPFVFVVS